MRGDFLILADGAQVSGDKLYVLGGGWSRVIAKQLPTTHHAAIAAGILVEWDETNIPHDFKIEVENEDSHKQLMWAEGQFEQGRPPGWPAGAAQRVMLAVSGSLQFETGGEHVVRLYVDGHEAIRQVFWVVEQGSA